VGQTSAETKREIDQTRAHLTQTLDAIQSRARRSLDLRYQVAHNRALQVSIGLAIFALAGGGLLIAWRQRRLSPAERLVRRLKLAELRERLNDFREDAQAWAVAQKRILKDENKSAVTAPPLRESALRRIGVGAAEAAMAAIAAGMAKRMMDRSRVPHEEAHPTAVTSRHR
jgi:hypothetical protein